MTTVRYQLMRPDQVLAARRRAAVAFVPIGPLEWHGPHLPLGTDGLHAENVAVRAAERVGGIVMPTVYAGADSYQGPGTSASLVPLGLPPDERVLGMDYPGNPVRSTYLDEGLIGLLVTALVQFLKREAYELIVIVNGHGATNHQATLRRVAEEQGEPDGTRVVYATAWVPPVEPALDPGHADRYETSVLMALTGSAVDVTRLPERPETLPYRRFGIVDGAAFDGTPAPDRCVPPGNDPRGSTTAEGVGLLEGEVDRLCAIVRDAVGEAVRDGRARSGRGDGARPDQGTERVEATSCR